MPAACRRRRRQDHRDMVVSDADRETRLLLGVIVFLTVLVLALPWWVALPTAFLIASIIGRIARSIE